MDGRPGTAPALMAGATGGLLLGRGGLKRMGTAKFAKNKGKLLVVAVDESRLARRSIFLAAWLMNTTERDKVQLVSVAKEGQSVADGERLIKEGNDILKMLGVRPIFITPGRVYRVEEGETVARTLAKAAKGGHLIIGAAGKRVEGEDAKKKGGGAGAALGGTALEALGICKAPVVLVKPKGTPAIDRTEGLTERMEGKASMSVVVCVDGSHLSQKAFDMAMRFVKTGDVVRVIHVFNSDEAMINPKSEEIALLGNSAIHTYYRDCCRRAEFAVSDVRFIFTPLKYRQSVSATRIPTPAPRMGLRSSKLQLPLLPLLPLLCSLLRSACWGQLFPGRSRRRSSLSLRARRCSLTSSSWARSS